MRKWIALCACLVATAGCAMTTQEITRIQVENELLREQVRIIRENCSYYRDLQLEVEEEPTASGGGDGVDY